MKISEVILEDNAKIELNEVWSPTYYETSVKDDTEAYHPSLSFASQDIALIGDGHGSLYILRDWKPIFVDSSICGVKRSFTVKSSLMSSADCISALLLYIEDKSKIENLRVKSKGNFVHVVEWVTFKLDDANPCVLSSVKRFAFLGEIESLELMSLTHVFVLSFTKRIGEEVYVAPKGDHGIGGSEGDSCIDFGGRNLGQPNLGARWG